MNIVGWTRAVACALVFTTLAACGGGGDSSGGSSSSSGGSAPPPPPPSGIGSAGGSVASGDAKVVIPAGALTTNTDIAVTKTASGAPVMPAGVTPSGDVFAFTPHGTAFAKPVTITVPFDPAKVPAGAVLVLYKTNATNTAWDVVHGATQNGNTLSAGVTGFSSAFVAPQPPEGFPALTEKTWQFTARNYGIPSAPLDAGTQVGGALEREHLVGADLNVVPVFLHDPRARLQVFSNESGKTFWTDSVSPQSHPDDSPRLNSSSAGLKQTYTFMVRDPSATLDFVFSRAVLEVFDGGGIRASLAACPWLDPTLPQETIVSRCADDMMWAQNIAIVNARRIGAADDFFTRVGTLVVSGSAGHLQFNAGPDGDLGIFDGSIFAFDGSDGVYLSATLKTPATVRIPLSSMHVGDLFNVTVDISSYTRSLVQGESFATALLRDPVNFDSGLTFNFTGLEQMPVNHDPVPAPTPAACPSPDDTAGQFELSAAVYGAPEKSEGIDITVRRVGGKHGEMKVLLETVDGTASAGTDFEAQHRVIRFGDGEGGDMIVNIPFVEDATEEGEETLMLKLTQFAGCATPGATTTAVLTIQDDDHVIAPPPTFTIGGTVTGLTGSGLVLRNQLTGVPLNVSNGVFTFPGTFLEGTNYSVVVDTQPANPLQGCTVANGSGAVGNANVTNIAVACTAPATPGSLDESFGDHGRAVTNVGFGAPVIGPRIGMVLQADGKILLVGGLKLLRMNADGTMDNSFGTAGVVSVVLNNATLDVAMDVGVQADGKIVVAGTTSTTTVGSDDFALTRFNTDGSLDTSFGTAGHVTTDFFGSTDQVRRMKIQPDGKIVVVGRAIQVIAPTSGAAMFAIARYNADGSPDTSFALGGKTADSPGQSLSNAKSLTIQSDGKIVVVGSTQVDGGSNPDTGWVRYLGDGQIQLPGTRDTGFGPMGNGVLQAPLGDFDEVVDVVTMSDGTILGAVTVSQGAAIGGLAMGFGLAHIPATGVPPPRVAQPVITFTPDSDIPNAMLMQADGKIVVVGIAANLGANPDFAIARFNDSGLALDTSFGTGGKLRVDFFGAADSAQAVVQQPDGKLLIGGFARSGSNKVFAVTRLTP